VDAGDVASDVDGASEDGTPSARLLSATSAESASPGPFPEASALAAIPLSSTPGGGAFEAQWAVAMATLSQTTRLEDRSVGS
jgi:hypothetical protein